MVSDLFEPYLDILPPPQLELWYELSSTPSEFVLYGGTALSLYLGHRASVDFDFFSSDPFQPDELQKRITYLGGAQRIQSRPNTLSCIVYRQGEPVNISFFGSLPMCRVGVPQKSHAPHVYIASTLDLAATKIKVIQDRAQAKDYQDVAALERRLISLQTMLEAAMGVFGSQFNPMISMRALTYFEDGNLSNLSSDDKNTLSAAVAKLDLSSLKPMPCKATCLSAEEGDRS